MRGLSDEALARNAVEGDMRAFEELVNRHRVSVYRLAWSVTRNHDDADDAAQETFWRIFRALDKYDPSRPFKPWMRKIAHNTSLNVLRTSRKRRKNEVAEEVHSSVDPSPGPEALLSSSQAGEQVQHALERLSPDLRLTLVLRVVEELSYREIAEATGVRLGTVMSRLSRARARIAEFVGPERTVSRGGVR